MLKKQDFQNQFTDEFGRIGFIYHIAPTKISLGDVTFKSMRNNILATNHVILCGVVPNLSNFIAPLRLKYIEKYPSIVILHPSPPTEKQWTPISMYPEIYYIKGSAMNHRDLLKANIMQAKNIIILAPDYSEVNRFLKFDVNLQADNQNNSANPNTATYRYAAFIYSNQGGNVTL